MAKNITFEERYTIECMLNSNYSLKSIYSCIKRTYRTLKREISRCELNKYTASASQKHASKKMSRKLGYDLDILAEEYIRNKLVEDQWSPMIISQRIESAGFEPISHTYIYIYIQKDKDSGGQLYKSLAHPNKYQGKKEYKGSIPNRVSIDQRPEVANDRERIGDIETDLIVSPKNQGSSLVSSVDRKSRFCCLDKVENKTKELVCDTVIDGLSNIGFDILSVTSDNGTEFTDHEVIAEKLETEYYFADPYSSYQRGSVEQLNGLVRRFIPKGTHIDNINQSMVKMVENKLNNRPRKVLGWLSPIEYLNEQGIYV
jgi:IS30 family transposase